MEWRGTHTYTESHSLKIQIRKSWFARTRAAKALCVRGGGRWRGVGGGNGLKVRRAP